MLLLLLLPVLLFSFFFLLLLWLLPLLKFIPSIYYCQCDHKFHYISINHSPSFLMLTLQSWIFFCVPASSLFYSIYKEVYSWGLYPEKYILTNPSTGKWHSQIPFLISTNFVWFTARQKIITVPHIIHIHTWMGKETLWNHGKNALSSVIFTYRKNCGS